MFSLAKLKAIKKVPLCTVQWIVCTADSNLPGELFSLDDDDNIIDGIDYKLINVPLYPLSSDGLLTWSSTSEATAAAMLRKLGTEGGAIATAMADGDDATFEEHKVALLSASSLSAEEVRELQAAALERVLGMPIGSSKLMREILLQEDLFALAWKAVSEALNPKPVAKPVAEDNKPVAEGSKPDSKKAATPSSVPV